MIEVAAEQLLVLGELLGERIGFRLGHESEGALRMALHDRLGPQPSRLEIERYLEALKRDDAELRRLLPLITVGKTGFYRDQGQFDAFRALLPALLETARAEGRPLSIWSAACSTGEETYTLALELAEAGASPAEIELLGSDVNPEAVLAARAGRFPLARAEAIPAPLLERWFELGGDGQVEARESLRRFLSLRVQNLNDGAILPSRASGWDVVFCRNVLIYFDGAALRRTIERLYQVIRPGGWLFLGYSESLFRINDRFKLEAVKDAWIYRKPKEGAAADLPGQEGLAALASGAAGGVLVAPSPKVASGRPNTNPTEKRSFGLARDGREGLAAASGRQPPNGARNVPERVGGFAARRPALTLAQGRALIQSGEFEAALALLEEALGAHPDDRGLWLTLGHVQVLLQRFERAASCYEKVIAIDPLLAEAHLFQGMFRLDRGEVQEAASSLARAVFLEPSLAWGHYFLGRCHERRKDLDAARRSYRNAVTAAARPAPHLLSYYPDLPEDGGTTVARAAALALAEL